MPDCLSRSPGVLTERVLQNKWRREIPEAAVRLVKNAFQFPFSHPGAVCKFCLGRQSELYQKEVSRIKAGLVSPRQLVG